VHPYLDDFSYALAGQRTGLWERWLHEYRHWNGRWASNVLVLRGPLVLELDDGLSLYHTVPVLLMVLTWVGAAALLRSLFGRLGHVRTWFIAALFVALYLHLMPHPGEGFYWYTGAISYQLPSALLLLHLAGMVMLWRKGASPARVAWLLLLMAWMAGSTEVHMVLLVVVQCIALVMQWRLKGRVDRVWWVLLGWAVVLGFVMLLAPGNGVRGAMFPARHDLLHTALYSTLQTGRFILAWLLSPALLLVSWLFLGYWAGRESGSPKASELGLSLVQALVLPFLLVYITMLLPYWSTGILGQHRTVNVALFVFLPAWFLALAILEEQVLRPRGWTALVRPGRWESWVWGALFVSLLVLRNDGHVTRELMDGTLRRYDAQLQTRYDVIRAAIADGAEEVEVPAVVDPPECLGILEPGPDPNSHWNRSMSAYFGADDMRLVVVTAVNTGATMAPAPE
jgi:hypothetical protein